MSRKQHKGHSDLENIEASDIEALETEEQDYRKSKSQIKREHLALQSLAKQLVALPEKQLERLALTEKLSKEILAAKTFKKTALKRQFQYLGALLYSEPVDALQIQEQLEKINLPNQVKTQRLHQVESWRDRLIEGDDELLEELFNNHENIDRQQLRQTVRNAQREKSKDQPPKAKRQLFKLLMTLT